MKQFACTNRPSGIIKHTMFPTVNEPKKIAPAMSIQKEVTILDETGKPLVGVHVFSGGSNTITNAKGEATISSNGKEFITLTHVGKITENIPFAKLGKVIVLKDAVESLDEVIITSVKSQKGNLWLWALVLGGGYLWYKSKVPKSVAL
ncbi:peptidase associated/transthyretin-like domain-containing protein [Aquimarina algiphila]|uniref:hypothetical protein n=1 Tax=Aquimarina algiphila TaxID=2047982 RepID=UPI002330CBA9|nr:hypothetical protein [Aquimarina algiphila]